MKTFVLKYPALIAALPLAVGISISYFSGINLSALHSALVIAVLCVIGLSVILLYKTVSKGELFLFTYLFLLVLFGLFSFQYKYYTIDDNSISKIAENEKELKTLINGTVIERPEVKDDRIRLMLGDISLGERSYSGNVLVTVYKNKFKDEIVRKYEYGDLLEIDGKLEDLPHRRNPGEFNYGEYLRLHNIDAIFTSFGYDNIVLKGNDPPGFYVSGVIIPVKEYSIKVIDELVGGNEGEYLKGLVIGERSNISREMKENFINAGVAHIIAVSGLNVAYVLIILWGILTFIPVKQTYKILISIFFLIFYMNLTGNTPSIIRATIMASIFLLAQIVERKPNSFNIVSAAALVILLIDPRQLFDAGFILSFTAIFSIIIVYPVLEKWLNNIKWFREQESNKLYIKGIRSIIILFTGTLAAQLGTLPITAVMFKKISIVSLLANIVAIPLSNLTLGLGFITIIASLISGWLASVFASLNVFLLHIQLVFIEFCAGLDHSFVETYFVDWLLFIFYYLVLWQFLSLSRKKLLFRIAVIILLALNFFMWKEILNKTDEAEITYLDTGTSPTSLITMPLGTSILINAGTSTEKYTSAERNIIPYLKTKGINELDLVIITSLNRNEFLNLKYLQENLKIGKILIPVYYKPVFMNEALSSAFKNTKVEFAGNHEVINKNGNFRVYLYYDSLLSGSSMMVRFTYGSREFLFAYPDDRIEDAINTGMLSGVSSASVLNLKGSFKDVSADFIVRSGPEYVIIPGAIGKKKTENEILTETLEKFGYKVSNTAGGGAVIFRTDGETLKKIEW